MPILLPAGCSPHRFAGECFPSDAPHVNLDRHDFGSDEGLSVASCDIWGAFGRPFFIDGGLEEMPTKIGVLYELSRGVANAHGAKPHFELR